MVLGILGKLVTSCIGNTVIEIYLMHFLGALIYFNKTFKRGDLCFSAQNMKREQKKLAYILLKTSSFFIFRQISVLYSLLQSSCNPSPLEIVNSQTFFLRFVSHCIFQ